jgi:tRNA modification GTPase
VLLLDTAGLRQSTDAIESEGMRRARAVMAQADRVLFMIDAAADPNATGYAAEGAQLPSGVPVTLVYNKVDLLPAGVDISVAAGGETMLSLSALQGTGLDTLRAHLLETAGFQRENSGTLSARSRHLEALGAAAAALDAADAQCRGARAAELVAEELRNAQHALGEITGAGTADELLGRIFATFCIGK